MNIKRLKIRILKRHNECKRRGVSSSEGFLRLRFGGGGEARVIYGMYWEPSDKPLNLLPLNLVCPTAVKVLNIANSGQVHRVMKWNSNRQSAAKQLQSKRHVPVPFERIDANRCSVEALFIKWRGTEGLSVTVSSKYLQNKTSYAQSIARL